MTRNLTVPPAPVAVPADAVVSEASVYTGTACLALIDSRFVADVWEDLLYDGFDHEHGPGGLMLNSASVGTHLDHDGDFGVRVFQDAAGRVLALAVNLDPYGSDLDSLRRPEDWTSADEASLAHSPGAAGHEPASHGENHVHDHDHDHGHGHGHAHGSLDGWSEPVTVRLATDRAVFGDPAGLPEADGTGGLLDVSFPAAEGILTVTVFTHRRVRRELLAVWSPTP